MVRTKEALHAEMATAMIVAALIPQLEQAAPDSMMLRELKEALRVAHPACFDEPNNKELHKEFYERAGRDPKGWLSSLTLPKTPVPSSALAVAGAAAPSSSAAAAPPQFTPEEAERLRALLSGAVPPVVPGDENTGTVGG